MTANERLAWHIIGLFKARAKKLGVPVTQWGEVLAAVAGTCIGANPAVADQPAQIDAAIAAMRRAQQNARESLGDDPALH